MPHAQKYSFTRARLPRHAPWLLAAALALIAAGAARADAALEPAGPDRLCVPGGGLCVRGQLDASGTHLSGAVAIETPIGDWALDDASLEIDRGRPSLRGTATIGLPRLGPLGASVSTRTTASIYIGYGDEGELDLAGRPLKLDAHKFYVAAALHGDLTVTAGGVTLFAMHEGTSLLFEPSSPILYADGPIASGLASALHLGGIDAFGLSLADGACFTYLSTTPFLRADGSGFTPRSFCGDLMIAGELSYELLAAEGTLVVELDASGDGTTAFGGDVDDVLIGANTTVSLSLPRVNASIDAVGASLYYDGRAEEAIVAATGGRDVMFGTSPLRSVFTGATISTYVTAGPDAQRLRFTATAGTLGGFAATGLSADVAITGSDATFDVAGSLHLPLGDVAVRGAITTAGTYRLTATADLAIHDMAVNQAQIVLTNDGVAVSATARARGPELEVDGAITTRRDLDTVGGAQVVGPSNFGMAGWATAELNDVPVANALLSAAPASGLRVKGSIKFAGTRFAIDGKFTLHNWDLTASVGARDHVSIYGIDGHARVRLTDDDFTCSFDGDVDPGGHVSGSIRADGSFCHKFGLIKICFDLL